MKNMAGLARVAIALMIAPAWLAAAPASGDAALVARVDRVLARTPVIDGHNDLAWQIRTCFGSVDRVDLRVNMAGASKPENALADCEWTVLMTDMPRLHAGRVGGQFWSVWVPPELTGLAAVKTTLEQIDLVHALATRYPDDLQMAYTADDIMRIQKSGRVASLIGIEGGHQIDNSLATLRQMYALGARYMTLTHTLNNDWADSATENPRHHGLTAFGRAVVHEMNRLGMLVDLSHVSPETMKAALAATQAPVMFSHSGARALVDHPRDVPDDVLALVKQNRGVVMVNFYPGYVSADVARWSADRSAEKSRLNSPPYDGLYVGQPERAKAAMAEWEKAHPAPGTTIAMVADHIDHIRQVAGVDCVGIGSDFDGIPNAPLGLEGVDKYPVLLLELARRGWSDADLAKVAGGNILRVLREAEGVAGRLQKMEGPSFATIAALDASTVK